MLKKFMADEAGFIVSSELVLIATMLVRTARPTATPTPAGPPEAL